MTFFDKNHKKSQKNDKKGILGGSPPKDKNLKKSEKNGLQTTFLTFFVNFKNIFSNFRKLVRNKSGVRDFLGGVMSVVRTSSTKQSLIPLRDNNRNK